MQLSDLTVEVRDVNLVRKGQITPEYLDCKLEPRYLAPGAWALKLPNEHPMAVELLKPGSGIIVTHTDPTVGQLLSGPSLSPARTADQSDPQGTSLFTGTTDDVLLWRRLTYPTPSTANVTQQVSAYDVRTGVAETVMRAFVNANLGPGAPAARKIAQLSLAADLARGPSVTYSARFDKLGELLASIARVAGLGFRIVQVGAGLQFQVYSVADKSALIRLDMANGTLSSQSVTRTAPTVTRAIVAGQGEGEFRTFVEVATGTTDEADWGLFGRIESFVDQRNTNDPVELTQAGTEAILDGASGVAVKAVPGDDQTMNYPTDWGLGDTLGLVVDNTPATAQVTAVPIIINASVGVRVGASVGDVQGWDPQAGIRKTQVEQDARLSNLERNLEAGTSSVVPPNSNLDTFVGEGTWDIDSTILATQTLNWPWCGIPNAVTADANNPAGSYVGPQVGSLFVHNTPTRVIQEATAVVNLGTGLLRTIHMSRARSGDGVTWGPWRMVDGVLSCRTAAEQTALGLLVGASRYNVLSVLRSDFAIPYAIQSIDGVQWMRENEVRQTSPQWKYLAWSAASGVANYNAPFAPLFVIPTREGLIHLRGLGTKGGSAPAVGTVLFTLPAGYRPAGQLMFGGPATDNSSNAWLQVKPNGDVLWLGSRTSSAVHLDANCIMFPAADVAPNAVWTPVTPDAAQGWSSYHLVDPTYPVAAYWQDSLGRVWFRGLMRRAAGDPPGDSQMFTTPLALAPSLQIHQGLAANGTLGMASTHYLGVPGNGTTSFVYKAGNPASASAWVSLSQLFLQPVANIPDGWYAPMSMAGGWIKYPSASFPAASVWAADDGIAHVRGLIQGGTAPPSAVTGSNGLNYRTSGEVLMFMHSTNNAMGRTDFTNAWAINVISGSTAWFSLDGMSYFLEG